ncbi:MAG: hypothetical protein HKO13_04830 [Sphingomonas sp.]|nr:hypothetical protein [Sphingomonas sp.]RZV50354.1 MAG: hypothetical protein EX258_05595 [Sphingomonadaceae bacterium]
MRGILALAVLFWSSLAMAQPAPSSAIVEGDGDQVFLQQTIVLDTDLASAWSLYTTSDGASRWMAPRIEVDLRAGGSMRSHYDPSATIGDPGTVEVRIVNYVPRRLLTLQADLSAVEADWLTPEVRAAQDQLYNVIEFEALGPDRTRITSWGIGYRDALGWEKMIAFFTRANEWTLGQLAAAVTEDK